APAYTPAPAATYAVPTRAQPAYNTVQPVTPAVQTPAPATKTWSAQPAQTAGPTYYWTPQPTPAAYYYTSR
ncbi:MAG TPA: hypothetical protein VMU04_05610, partial [Candidatus Acidoferrum sp.]|nr:hypothetical protein [Candidatus Acidoferrum sp.]